MKVVISLKIHPYPVVSRERILMECYRQSYMVTENFFIQYCCPDTIYTIKAGWRKQALIYLWLKEIDNYEALAGNSYQSIFEAEMKLKVIQEDCY